jgi:hypothetical protein
MNSTNPLPDTGFLRIWQIVGDKKRNIPPLIPIGRTTFLNNVKSKKYPYLHPVKLGERTTAYKVEDIRRLIIELGGTA